jgi:transcriptional regulator with XRE-family HTH domain
LNDSIDDIQIGRRIREYRQMRRLSITELARKAGISKSMLSQVERDLCNPSLSVLRSLATELGVSLPTLFVQNNLSDFIVRRDARQEIRVPGSSVKRQLLVPDTNRETILWHATIPAGAVSSSEPTSHRAEECVLVLKGTVEIHVGSHSVELHEGDTYYIDSNVKHYLRNPTSEVAQYLTAGANNFHLNRTGLGVAKELEIASD